ncbi:MAG: aldehyde dehydrogenase family protein, partial [Planctomycetota bacterium]
MTTERTEPAATLNLPPFKNERIFPGIDDPTVREAFPQAIATVRGRLGRVYPLYIDGQDVTTDATLDSVNPADPDEVVGKVCQAGTGEVDRALDAAERALVMWRDVDPAERAAYLV